MSYQVCLIYTLGISVLSFIIGNFFAILLAFMRMSQKPWLKYPARIYISFMRGIPMLVVLFILYFGLPYVGIQITRPSICHNWFFYRKCSLYGRDFPFIHFCCR